MEKSIFIFDLDGTLAQSKNPVGSDVGQALCLLLKQGGIVAVISGGKLEQLKKQFLASLKCDKSYYKNIYLMPTSGAALYSFDEKNLNWKSLYEHNLSYEEKELIKESIKEALGKLSYQMPNGPDLYGEQVEDRGSQISISALGQEAPLEKKLAWDSDKSKRKELAELLKENLADFNVAIGGSTTVDITKKGIDKGFGVEEFLKFLKLEAKQAIFFGDELGQGGNDSSVNKSKVETIEVSSPDDLLKKLGVYIKGSKV